MVDGPFRRLLQCLFTKDVFCRRAASVSSPDTVIYEVVLEKENGSLGIVTSVSFTHKQCRILEMEENKFEQLSTRPYVLLCLYMDC